MTPVIKGVVFTGKSALFTDGDYSVHLGYMESATREDIPHYLIVNDLTGVIEGSSARMFEARALAVAFNRELTGQTEALAKGVDILEKEDSPSKPPPVRWN